MSEASRIVLLMNENIECLDSRSDDCVGEVEYRMPLSGTGRPFPRCDKHWSDRLDVQARLRRDYGVGSDVAPVGFDPTYAGERWDSDY